MSGFHVGFDLDNTIIDYRDVFADVGRTIGLLDEGHGLTTKDDVKTFLRDGPGGDADWMRLQGQVYGRHIARARAYPGALGVVANLHGQGVRVSIVSHKTEFGHYDADRVPLWQAARDWLEAAQFLAPAAGGIAPSDVHFCPTRGEKLAMIGQMGCDVFVDDLIEVLTDPKFPGDVHRLWFAPTAETAETGALSPHRSWHELAQSIARLHH